MKIFFLFSLLVLVSCAEQNDSKTNQVEHKHTHSDEIVLDDGDKWKVDTNMIVFIRNMENDINKQNADATDFSVLAKALDENLNLLTSNCTMSGQAHDELHKWLLPFIDTAGELSEAGDAKAQRQVYLELKKAMEEFNYFFE